MSDVKSLRSVFCYGFSSTTVVAYELKKDFNGFYNRIGFKQTVEVKDDNELENYKEWLFEEQQKDMISFSDRFNQIFTNGELSPIFINYFLDSRSGYGFLNDQENPNCYTICSDPFYCTYKYLRNFDTFLNFDKDFWLIVFPNGFVLDTRKLAANVVRINPSWGEVSKNGSILRFEPLEKSINFSLKMIEGKNKDISIKINKDQPNPL